MLKPKQLFIIIYVNVCVKCVYPHKANNNILFRNGKILESQFWDFFTRNTPKKFKYPPPNLKSWIRPCRPISNRNETKY